MIPLSPNAKAAIERAEYLAEHPPVYGDLGEVISDYLAFLVARLEVDLCSLRLAQESPVTDPGIIRSDP